MQVGLARFASDSVNAILARFDLIELRTRCLQSIKYFRTKPRTRRLNGRTLR
jgi:hypothetical protein